ncbi:MAG: DNA gyrase/topoisomerase IV subunit B [Candidatus Micrarchaeia archaeon]
MDASPAASDNDYSAKDIMVLSGPMGVRKRPAMYIGSTGSSGFLHLLYEVIDNAIDEALAGYCNSIVVKLSKNNDNDVATVIDNGRGIPVDIIPKENRPALEVVMTSLHSGAKFSDKIYKVSGGLHGVGLTVVNALSEFTVVTVKKNGHIYRQQFSRGQPVSQLEIIGDTEEHGTEVTFMPDPEIFGNLHFDSGFIKERLRYVSFLNPRLRLRFIDERGMEKDDIEFYSENGIKDFINYISNGKNSITNPIIFQWKEDTIMLNIALQYNDSYDELIESFVNNIKTEEGGTHVIGFRSGLSRALVNYYSKNMEKGKQDIKITGDDIREGLVAIVSVLMQNPEFEGQTKEKLGNTKIKNIVESGVYSNMSRYLEEHPQDAKNIINKITSAAIARESARKARDLARKRNAFDNMILPGKLADCIIADPDKAELFIVEGESAGGSSKQGRDKKFQAILPLRGKILNVEKAGDERIFNNIELRTIISALGVGIKDSFNINNIRYNKIIIMSDADVDGSHIQTLILTFFYRFLRPIIEKGYVYIAQPPLYKVSRGKEVFYCYSDDELAKKLGELDGKANVQRYKGLGEMNPEQLWETTMDPEKRILRRVSIKDAERANTLFSILMGIDVAQRRKFLEEHSGEVSYLDI